MMKKPPFYLLLLGFIMVSCYVIPAIMGYSAGVMTTDVLMPPSNHHIWGTDALGRDVFVQCLFATRNTIIIGFSIATIAGIIGILVGAVAALSNNTVDSIISEITNFFMSIPTLFLILFVFSAFSLSALLLIFVIALSLWTGTAKIVRTQVKACNTELFITQQYLLGESKTYVFMKHILPHTYRPVIANMALGMSSACVVESGLSFIGVKCVELSLGTMLNHGQSYIFTAWWISAFSSLMLVIICFLVILLVDFLNAKEAK